MSIDILENKSKASRKKLKKNQFSQTKLTPDLQNDPF